MNAPNEDDAPARWFLSATERGNPHTRLGGVASGHSWTVGDSVEPVVHSAD